MHAYIFRRKNVFNIVCLLHEMFGIEPHSIDYSISVCVCVCEIEIIWIRHL